jgi:uncharacterized membrane protein YhdT
VIYTRERNAQVYSTFAYWASMAIVNLPLLFVSHIIFVSIAYWMIGATHKPTLPPPSPTNNRQM